MFRIRYSAPAALIATLLAGCSGDADENRVEVFPVSGVITMNGKPVEGATVVYSPTGKQPTATGLTDSDGAYSLQTYEAGDGAAAGEYVVLVTKAAPSAAPAGGNPDAGHDAYTQGGPAASHAPSSKAEGVDTALPEQYASATSSPLKVKVPSDDEKNYSFDLK